MGSIFAYRSSAKVLKTALKRYYKPELMCWVSPEKITSTLEGTVALNSDAIPFELAGYS
jgi:hypothetical protein